MRKNKIRLTLNRETLRSLTSHEMSEAGGGDVLTANGCPIITYTCFNCLTKVTCPTFCGQTYC